MGIRFVLYYLLVESFSGCSSSEHEYPGNVLNVNMTLLSAGLQRISELSELSKENEEVFPASWQPLYHLY